MMRKRMPFIGLALLAGLVLPQSLRADVIHLRNGRTFQVETWQDVGDAIEFSLWGGTVRIPKDQVLKIEQGPGSGDIPKFATPPSGTTSPPGKGPGQYSPEEETALNIVTAIYLLEEFDCKSALKRYCTIEELVKGPKPGKGLKSDPRLDQNYEYRLTIHGGELDISAIPRRPGLGGFFRGSDLQYRYNPNGPATNNDKPVKEGANALSFVR